MKSLGIYFKNNNFRLSVKTIVKDAFKNTMKSPITDTSNKRTLPLSGHSYWELISSYVSSIYINLSWTDSQIANFLLQPVLYGQDWQ